jgi:sugar-specific transcriptional regulator TrmB
MDEASLRQFLQSNIDMSEYESLVYLALINHGKQTMKQLSASSGVPKQRVYDTVETLRERGFVGLDDSYPKQAYAIEPTQTLGPILDRIEQVQNQLEELHQTISDIESGVTQIENSASIDKYVSELLSSAEHTVFLLSSRDRATAFQDELTALDDVQVRLIVSDLDHATINDGIVELGRSVDNLANYARGTLRSEPFVLSVDRRNGFFWPNSPSRT